jgi:NADH-quinone oxidoreductase subunit E
MGGGFAKVKERHDTGNGQCNKRSNMLVAVECIMARHGYKRSELIAMLQEIQESYHYLPEEALNYLATALGISPTTVFGVATFYAQFSLDPKGKYLVRVCDGTACHVKGSHKTYDRLLKKLKLREGKATTSDRLFTLETVACLGACGIAPVMVINDTVHSQVTPEAAEMIIDALIKREAEPEAETAPVGEMER